jgi:phosphatidylglycerophosphate synthase
MSGGSDVPAALALAAVGVAVPLAYQLAGGRRRFARVEQQGGSVVLAAGLMHAGYWMLQPLISFCVRARVSPTALSWLSLVPAAGAALAAARGHWGWAAWGLFLSALLDVVDGAVARAAGRATPAGAILDSALDRYAEGFFFAGVIFYYRSLPAVQLLAVAALFGSFMITYSTAKAEALRLAPPRGFMKRSDRLAVLIAGAVLAPVSLRWLEAGSEPRAWPVLAAVGLIAVGANLSAVIRLTALARAARP